MSAIIRIDPQNSPLPVQGSGFQIGKCDDLTLNEIRRGKTTPDLDLIDKKVVNCP